ncbi:MAG: autoinducer binding domain-containing protein [Deltaproteobacteria bacterium]|nr:autoinducer binding domain-containing protein [Deltaproteobacteria bacterium]
MFNAFSKTEIVGIMETIEAAHLSANETGLKAVLQKAAHLLEAQYSACGVASSSFSRVASVNVNYPAKWFDSYVAERLYLYDPVVRYQMNFPSTVNWENISRHSADKESRAFFARAGGYGLVNGISSGVYNQADGSLSVFSFAGGDDSFGARNKKILETLSPHLNIALSRLKLL